MTGVSTTGWWIVGWAAGGAVVLVASGLLLIIIALARRIAGQAGEIVAALDGARANTEALFDLASVNHSLEAIGRRLGELDASGGGRPREGLGGRIARGLRRFQH